ncbi:MAG: hypothetical protein J6A19_14260 [Oscillospiraceae bacterium]|nr:hypothetical protein [Oscillospiraceae bacterium]
MGVDFTAVREKIMEFKPFEVLSSIGSKLGLKKENDLFRINIEDISSYPGFKEFVQEYKMRSPEDVVKFFMDYQMAQFNAISASIDQVEKLIVGKSFADIKSAMTEIKISGDENDTVDHLTKAWDLSEHAVNELQEALADFVDYIRKIDESSGVGFIWNSLRLNKAKTENELAKRAAAEILAGYCIMFSVSTASGHRKKLEHFRDEIAEFEEKLVRYDVCGLMGSYDDSKSDFWQTFPEQLRRLINNSALMTQYLTTSEETVSYDENEINFEDVTF